jgi:anti-sigma B factor antagonist
MENQEIQTLQVREDITLIKLPSRLLGGSLTSHFTESIELAKRTQVKYVLVDLGNVEVINSLGLGMIVAGYTSLKKNSIPLILISPTEKVQNLLKITHLDTIFKIYNSLDEFLQQINSEN